MKWISWKFHENLVIETKCVFKQKSLLCSVLNFLNWIFNTLPPRLHDVDVPMYTMLRDVDQPIEYLNAQCISYDTSSLNISRNNWIILRITYYKISIYISFKQKNSNPCTAQLRLLPTSKNIFVSVASISIAGPWRTIKLQHNGRSSKKQKRKKKNTGAGA